MPVQPPFFPYPGMQSRAKWLLCFCRPYDLLRKCDGNSNELIRGDHKRITTVPQSVGGLGTWVGEGVATGGSIGYSRGGWKKRLNARLRTVSGFLRYLSCPECASGLGILVSLTPRPLNPTPSNTDGETEAREFGCVPTVSSVRGLAQGQGVWWTFEKTKKPSEPDVVHQARTKVGDATSCQHFYKSSLKDQDGNESKFLMLFTTTESQYQGSPNTINRLIGIWTQSGVFSFFLCIAHFN